MAQMIARLHERRTALAGLALTLAALGGLLAESPPAAAPTAYLLLIALLAVLAAGEPRLRRALAGRPWLGRLVIVLGAAVGVLAVLLPVPADQTFRLNRMPFGAWVVAAHGWGLGLLLVALAAGRGTPARRWSGALGGALAAALIVLAILSLGRFMPLDLPDEPWLAAAAVHFAQAGTGALAPGGISWAYGIPEPALQRYYLAMGLWLRAAGDQSLLTLRTFPLLSAGLSAALFTLALRRDRRLTGAGRLIGLAALLSLSAFVRASHNLRADIGLAAYGAVIVWALVELGRAEHSRPAAFLAGLALWPAMECIPTAGLALAAGLGGVLLADARRGPGRRALAAFAAGGGLALALYVAVHFVPDFTARWAAYRRFVDFYHASGWFGPRNPLPSLVDYHLRFSLILSPVELPMVAGVGGWLLCRGDRLDRRVLAAGGLAALLLLLTVSAGYGYWAAFAPFAAYTAARAAAGRTLVLLAALTALAAVPLRDMAYETALNRNAGALAAADLLTGQIPTGALVAADESLWFTLHAGRTVLLWPGLERYAASHGQTLAAALRELGPQVAICRKADAPRCAAAFGARIFAPPLEFFIRGEPYLIFWRRD